MLFYTNRCDLSLLSIRNALAECAVFSGLSNRTRYYVGSISSNFHIRSKGQD